MRVGVALVAVVGAALVACAGADANTGGASPGGRAKFVKHADNICQPARNAAKRRVAHGVRLLQRRRPSARRAGRHFMHAYRDLRAGYRQIAHLSRPFADHRRIGKWLRREREATGDGVRSAIALKRQHLKKARRLARTAAIGEQLAYRPVRNLDFTACRPL